MDSDIRTQTVQTISNDLHTFNEFLSTLIMVCERLQVDIQTVKEDLRKAKRVAKQTKSKAAEDVAALTVVNVGLGIGGVATILLTGGIALPILFCTGQVIANICSSEIKKEYETNIERIMAAVDDRSKQCKQRARMVINKKKTYEKTLNTLIENGTEKDLAIFYTVCGMLNEMRQGGENSTFITYGERAALIDSTTLGVQQTSVVDRVVQKKETALFGISLVSLEKYAPEWLVNATRSVKNHVPKLTPKLVGAATAVLTASVEVCSAVRFILSENKAVESIDETTLLLDEGVSTLDFFIKEFITLRVHSLQKLNCQLEIEKKEAKEALLRQAQQQQQNRNRIIFILSAVFLFFALILAFMKM